MELTKAVIYPILQPISLFYFVAAANMAITASHRIRILLAGGSKMLTVYAFIKAIVKNFQKKLI